MRPVGFDKRAYAVRGTILAIALAATAGYWYEWFHGTGGVWPVILASLVSALLIVLSEHKRYMLILSFGMLAALGVLGVLRTLVTDEPLLPGIIILGVVLCAFVLVGGHRRDVNWLFREDTFGQNSGFLELNLRLAPHRGEKSQDSNSENQAHQDSKTKI